MKSASIGQFFHSIGKGIGGNGMKRTCAPGDRPDLHPRSYGVGEAGEPEDLDGDPGGGRCIEVLLNRNEVRF